MSSDLSQQIRELENTVKRGGEKLEEKKRELTRKQSEVDSLTTEQQANESRLAAVKQEFDREPKK